jgi:serine/threonine-protein kinase haspin
VADLVSKATDALDSLKLDASLAKTKSRKKVEATRRKPLSKRDGNSRPTSKHGSEDGKSACTKSEVRKQTVEDEVLARQSGTGEVVVSQVAEMSQPFVEASSSIYELCDAYIRPLVALTNEQRIPLAFDAWSDALIPHFSISKIAEASYSEVYRLSLLEDHPTLSSADESVLKLVALKPLSSDTDSNKTKAQQKREDNMSAIEDVVSEVRLLKRMTEIPGFTNYRALHILQGRPSKPFVQAWKEWNKARRKGEKSEFPDPSRKANYDENQYWAVIEMQDAGTDVEKLIEDEAKDKASVDENGLRSIWATWDIFWQTALAVAKGESAARFEHRDLHLGNICVRRKGDDHIELPDVHERKLGFTNLETTIIDYTLSRADMTSSPRQTPQSSSSDSSQDSVESVSTDRDEEVEVAYNPLQKQPQIFEGDAEDEYQYEIYRYMCKIVSHQEKSELDPWRPYQPKTNLLWLHFVLHKLHETIVWPSDITTKKKDKRQKKALELEAILMQLEDLLSVERLLGEDECVLNSVAELVALALEQGWLDAEDINA